MAFNIGELARMITQQREEMNVLGNDEAEECVRLHQKALIEYESSWKIKEK